MGYRCKTCRAAVPSGTPRLVHVVKRADGSIARELAVCKLCQEFLARGTSANVLASEGSIRTKLESEADAEALPQQGKKVISKLIPTGD